MHWKIPMYQYAILLVLLTTNCNLKREKKVRETIPSEEIILTCMQDTIDNIPATVVHINVPSIPEFQCDVWCYEDALKQGECFPQNDGSLIMKHKHPNGAVVETRVVPSVETIDWYVTVTGPSKEAVKSIITVNGCMQFKNAQGFQSLPDKYVESFANQCFIYTDSGFTFLKDTERYPDTRKPADDPVNSPPWVQAYYPVWVKHPGQPEASRGRSTTRYIYSIAGVVSRDMKYMAAWGSKRSEWISQVWKDCIHLHPYFLDDYDEKTNTIISHSRMYFMEYDPDKLLARYKVDFLPEENPERIE